MSRKCVKLATAVGTLPINSSCYCASSNHCFTVNINPSSRNFVTKVRSGRRDESSLQSQPVQFPLFTKFSTIFPSAASSFSFSCGRRNYSSDGSRHDCVTAVDGSKSERVAQSSSENANSSRGRGSSSEMMQTSHLHSSSMPTNSLNDYKSCSINSSSSSRQNSPVESDYSKEFRANHFNDLSGTCSSSASSTAKLPTTSAFGLGTPFTSIRTVVTSQRLVEVSGDSGAMEQPKLLSKEEREEFMSMYHKIVRELLEIPDMKDMEETNRWMARVLQYNVPHGKRNRGLSTVLAYKYLAPGELTEENVQLAYVLGWCVEILQAFFLVSDDIMDGSETRRGRPCWYKVDNLGLAAVNDSLLLEATIYKILQKHFSNKPCYPKLMEIMHDVTYKTIFGQSLDTRTGMERRMETYTMERYSSIVKYKTSYYSFYLPVALAMALCDITDPILTQQVKKVTLEMGHFFQVQDDYLDCFGDVEVTGKIGTDIQDCKCSWLFVVAMQRCNPDQKKYLLANYGKHEKENVDAVKQLYKELELEEVYHTYEEQTYNMICTHIQQMNEELPKGLFYDMLHKIYKRSS